MSDCIWVCNARKDSLGDFGFFPDYNGGEDRDAETDLTYDRLRRISAGEVVPKDEMPNKFFHSTTKDFKGTLPDFFEVQHFFFKDTIASIIRNSNMGDGYFHPCKLFQWDRTTEIAQDLFVLCIGNAKDTVVIEKTEHIAEWYDDIYRLPFRPKDGQIVCRSSALQGPDIWCDPHIGGSYFFLKPQLADALIVAGMKERMGLVPTTTI